MQKEEKLPTTLEELVKPDQCAVIVIDMQNDFCHDDGLIPRGELDPRHVGVKPDMTLMKACIPALARLIESARSAGVRIFFVRFIEDDRYQPLPLLMKKRQVGRTKTLCEEGTWGAEFIAGLVPKPGDAIVTKYVYSALIATDLEKTLQDAGIRTLIVTGVATEVCVESTIRDGCQLGFNIVEPRDCVASYDGAGHQSSLTLVRRYFGWVTSSEEIRRCWES